MVPIQDVEEDKELIEDLDCDYLENKMMNKLTKEKQMIKNWHTVLMRIQMIHAFKLSMKIQDQPYEPDLHEEKLIEKAWWESGSFTILPE